MTAERLLEQSNPESEFWHPSRNWSIVDQLSAAAVAKRAAASGWRTRIEPVQGAGDSQSKHQPERGDRVPADGLVVSALFFFPRGGSAQVTRSLARALPAAGWQPRLAAGSLGQPGAPTHAGSFFAGIDVHALDYSPAPEPAEPLAAPVPFQPSYEDRPDA